MDEFAMGSTTETSYGEITKIHGIFHVPGGSSGGSAAAVAGREVPLPSAPILVVPFVSPLLIAV